jgi:hypothetical protein
MFKVKAIYDYSSPHDDDLSFKIGQVITVVEEEDADWYVGEYADDTGTKQEGLFPKNFVEKYEPAPPPRPNRTSRYKPMEQPAAEAAPPTPQITHHDSEPLHREEPEPPKPEPPQVLQPPPAIKAEPTPTPMSPLSPPAAASARPVEVSQVQEEKPKPSPAAKKGPPPVAVKSNAFRDRIAAFNAPAAAPIQPFKPGGAPSTFIKKPFVAPPPSRNSFVPPPKEAPQVKSYRREEDPEIAERRAQDQEAADRAGLVSHDTSNTQEQEEENQPKISLKERIALLQKQQQEQAERAAAATHKEKPKRPPVKKRTESHGPPTEDSEDTSLEKMVSRGSRARESLDDARPPRTPTDTRPLEPHHNHRELVSENDADQSGAGETEDAGGSDTSVEGVAERSKHAHPPLPIGAFAAPVQEPSAGDEQTAEDEEDEEEEEDEMDAETRRKLELRERMAKMSGGMGMPGMFGGVPLGGLPPRKKKPTEKQLEEHEENAPPQQRVAMFPMPGMPSVRSPDQEDKRLVVEKEDEVFHPVTGTHAADEVPDVEDVAPQPVQRTATGERPPPIPSDSKFIISRKAITCLPRRNVYCCQLPSSETVSKTYLASDGVSEYVMTVSVSSMFGVADFAPCTFIRSVRIDQTQDGQYLLQCPQRVSCYNLPYSNLSN